MRPDKDHYYLDISKSVSERSPCLRRRFGAIVVVDDSIVSTGYNGPARGVVNCEEVGCIKDILNLQPYKDYDLCPAVHAEENAIINAARNGVKVLGGDVYIYGEKYNGDPSPSYPCNRCKRVLINSGIEKVITMDEKKEIVVYEVEKWINEDTKKYLKALKDSE